MDIQGRPPDFIKNLCFMDFVVLFLAAAITVFITVKIYGNNASLLQFVIQGKRQQWVYPVNQTAHIEIPGLLGNTAIVIKDGSALIASSPCVNQTCVSSPSIHRRGQWIACLPNAVLVRVESAGGRQADHGELDGTVW